MYITRILSGNDLYVPYLPNSPLCQSLTAFEISKLPGFIKRIVVIFARIYFISEKSNVCASSEVIM